MTSDERYARAQKAEKGWWADNAWTPFIQWYFYDKVFYPYYNHPAEKYNLAIDVGSGPVPILCNHNVFYKEGISVDPLNNEYAKMDKYRKFIVKPYKTVLDIGEVKRKSASGAFCLNVLDHVQYPAKTLRAIFEALGPGGNIFIYVDIFGHMDHAHMHCFSRNHLAEMIMPLFKPVLWLEKKSWKFDNHALYFVGEKR